MKEIASSIPGFRMSRVLIILAAMTISFPASAGNPGQSYIKACDDGTAAPERQGKDCLYLGKIYLGGSASSVKEPEGKAAQKKGCKLFDKACKSDVYNCLKYADAIEEYEVEKPPKSPEKIRSDAKAKFETLCNKKDDPIACHLRALLYEEGLWGSPVDEKKAAELYSKSCKNGNPKLTGYITPAHANRRPCDTEKKLNKKFEQDKKKERFFKLLSEIEKIKKLPDLEKLCSKGEPEACNAAADKYAKGQGVKKSKSKAEAFRTKALTIWKEACDWYGMTYQTRSNGYECVKAGYAFQSAEINNPKLYAKYLREGISRLGSACVNLKNVDACYWTAVQQKSGQGTHTWESIHDQALKHFKLACAQAKSSWIKKRACHQVKLYKTSPSGTPYDPSTEKSKDGRWKIGDAERLTKKGDKCEKICGAKVFACADKVKSQEPNILNTNRMKCYGPDGYAWGSDYTNWTLGTCLDKCRECVKGGVRKWHDTTCSVCAHSYAYDRNKLYCYAGTNANRKIGCDLETRTDYQHCIATAKELPIPSWRGLAMADCRTQQKYDASYCRSIPSDFKSLMTRVKTTTGASLKHVVACCRDEVDSQGRNVLHSAAGAGNLNVVKYLVEGADVSDRVEVFAKDKYGKTSLDFAEQRNHTEVVTYLRSKGAKRGGEYPPVFPVGSKQDVPTFTKISPPGGPSGATLAVTGNHLDNDRAVYKLGKMIVKPTELTKKKLGFTIPKTARTSYFSVTVGGWIGEYPDEVIIYKAPRLTKVKPNFAVVGQEATVNGLNLEIIKKLTIGGKNIPIASKSSKAIVFKVPAGTKTGALVVTGPGGSASLKKDYEIFYPPVITKVVPQGGQPGTEIKISGKYLNTLQASFKLGRTKLKPVSVTEKMVIVTVPKQGKSSKLSVTAKKKIFETKLDYLVYHAPKLTRIKPLFGVVGQEATVNGLNLEIIKKLTISGKNIPITSKSSKAIVFKVPAGTKTGALVVTGPGGNASLKKEYEIFYRPVITKAVPQGGQPGTAIKIIGNHLDATKAVFKLGRANLKTTSITATQAVATVPANAKSGVISVTAKKNKSESPKEFTVYHAPKLVAAKPKTAAVGATVTVSGKNLDHIKTLKIGTKTIKIDSKADKKIVFTIPKGTKSGPLTVSGPGGEAQLKKDFVVTPSKSSQPVAASNWLHCPIGMVWNGKGCTGMPDRMTWKKAGKACPKGYRVPTRGELAGLLSNCNLAVERGENGSCSDCSSSQGCKAAFESSTIRRGAYWSSTAHDKKSTHYVSFKQGQVSRTSKTNSFQVLCVAQ
jgi:TPR repeat protein